MSKMVGRNIILGVKNGRTKLFSSYLAVVPLDPSLPGSSAPLPPAQHALELRRGPRFFFELQENALISPF
jgi:hypothetical protein